MDAKIQRTEIIVPSPAARLKEGFRKNWYKFSRNKLSIAGLVIVLSIIVVAILAPYVAPYPKHAGKFVDYVNANQGPSAAHFLALTILDGCFIQDHLCL